MFASPTVKLTRWWKDELQKLEGGIAKFAQGYHTFGFTRQADNP